MRRRHQPNLLAISTFVSFALAAVAQPNGCTEENGNYYCNKATGIQYSNFGFSGTYNKVTGMDTSSGACSSTEQAYGGGIAPLDEELSWHFRGPMHLKQFAFYTFGGSDAKSKKPKRSIPDKPHQGLHAHQQFHRRQNTATEEAEDEDNTTEEIPFGKRAPAEPAFITATINGKVVSWPNPHAAGATPPPPAADAGTPNKAVPNQGTNNPAPPQANPDPATTAPSGSWGLQSYYNAATLNASGLVFLNNKGDPAISATFDYVYGNSLSFANADGSGPAKSATPLGNGGWIEDNNEIALFAGSPCSEGSGCGTYRPQSVAYHGFAGSSKLFLLDFDMPLSGKRGFNMDMPSAWILNAQIPRTGQYVSQKGCSCWASGCGEFDVFEVLDSGNAKCKSTWHGKNALGSSDYFARPTAKGVKVAVVMDGEGGKISVVELGVEVRLGDGVVSGEMVKGWLGKVSKNEKLGTSGALG